MPGVGASKGGRRRRRHGEGGRGNRERDKRRMVLFTWSLVVFSLTLVAMGVAVWLWAKQNRKPPEEADEVAAAMPRVEERVASRFASPSRDAALEFVRRALAIREAAQVTEYFRPGAATPGEIVDFLRGMEATDGPVDGLDWLSSLDANGLLLDGVMVHTNLDGGKRNRLALLTPDDKGRWQIDFEAFARVVKPSWPDLLGTGRAEGVVRVIINRDNYYNGPFLDESQWVCFGMGSPDHEQVLLGYARKGSAQAKALARILKADGPSPQRVLKRATLAIRRPEGAEARQFEITRVIAEDWVRGGRDFQELAE